MVKKIWNDPVGSKVISAGIIAILAAIFAYLRSRVENIPFRVVWTDLIDLKIKLIYVLAVFLVFSIIRALIKKKPKNASYYSDKQLELKENNQSLDEENGILLKWTVYFSSNSQPFVSNLDAFCIRHGGVPIRFMYNCCPDYNCQNSQKRIDMEYTKNNIESKLIHEWDEINKK